MFSVHLDVNQGSTNRNREACNIAFTDLVMNPGHKLTYSAGHIPAPEKVGMNMHFQAS